MKRRTFLTTFAKIGAAAYMGPLAPAARAATTITYVGWGGSAEAFRTEHLFKPFTEETDVGVQYVAGPDLARIKAQVTTNAVQWDVVEVAGSQAYAGAKQGFWETVDTSIIDPHRFLTKPPPFAVPTDTFFGGIAYAPSRVKPVRDFADFFDAKNFPGRRSIKTRPDMVLEMALLADGVAPNNLYPLDVGRAFKVLDRIKPHVTKWWDGTNESISLLERSEADYTFSFSNRIRTAKEGGAPVDFCFGQCLIQRDYIAVLKGTRNKSAAMRLMDFATRQEYQTSFCNTLGLGSPVKDVVPNEAAKRWIADQNNLKNVVINDEYWADNFVELEKRFKEWIIT